MLYTENDWVYVVSEENKEVREGFIPHSYCAALGSQQATLILNMKLSRSVSMDMLFAINAHLYVFWN